jgi:hypothetical protein
MKLSAAGFVVSLVAAVTGCLSAQSTNGETAIQTTSGRVSGIGTRDGGVAYLGIPYAAPPVGARRWRPPEPACHGQGFARLRSSVRPVPRRDGPAPLLI